MHKEQLESVTNLESFKNYEKFCLFFIMLIWCIYHFFESFQVIPYIFNVNVISEAILKFFSFK